MTDEKRRPGRPYSGGETPKRYLRMGSLWDEAAELAKQRGETTTELVTRAVERELRRARREAERKGSAPTVD